LLIRNILAVCSSEGATVLPAQGNALGMNTDASSQFVGLTGQQFCLRQHEWLARWADIVLFHFIFPGRCPGLEEQKGLRPKNTTKFAIFSHTALQTAKMLR
jgi:hypothetical protein